MRILFMTQLLPLPLDAGPKIRAYYVLRYLVEAGHEVTLICFVRPRDCAQDIRGLRKVCRSVETIPLIRSRLKDFYHGLHSLFSATPFLILRDQVVLMERRLEQITENRSFDALHADQLWMAPYGLRVRGATLRVLDQHNAVFVVFRRMAEHERNSVKRTFLHQEASKLEVFERVTCKLFDRIVWVTEEDRKAVRGSGNEHHPRDRIIPIAIDPFARRPVKGSHPFRVTFLGGMHWPPNSEGISWFAERVWPRVAAAVPSSVLTLIGEAPPRELCRQGSNSRVEVTGHISDLEQYLSETAVFVVPIRSGAGMRVKILDAWCWGLPVVSTSVGAEGIKTVAGENLLIADDEKSLVDSVVRVMRERHLARRLSENGRATVEKWYDWRKVYNGWDQIYR
jgi:glycosyltransferase involved in cell wall biosynthesis